MSAVRASPDLLTGQRIATDVDLLKRLAKAAQAAQAAPQLSQVPAGELILELISRGYAVWLPPKDDA